MKKEIKREQHKSPPHPKSYVADLVNNDNHHG